MSSEPVKGWKLTLRIVGATVAGESYVICINLKIPFSKQKRWKAFIIGVWYYNCKLENDYSLFAVLSCPVGFSVFALLFHNWYAGKLTFEDA